MVSFNPCVGPSTRIEMLFPLLSTYADQLMVAPKIKIKTLNENQMLFRSHYFLYLPESVFLVTFKDKNKELFNVKPVFKFLHHGVSV